MDSQNTYSADSPDRDRINGRKVGLVSASIHEQLVSTASFDFVPTTDPAAYIARLPSGWGTDPLAKNTILLPTFYHRNPILL